MSASNNFGLIKSSVPLLPYISHTTGLKMAGSHLEECPECKGHDCFSLSTDSVSGHGRYKCFQCNISGTIVDFAMLRNGCTEYEALKICADYAGITLEAGPNDRQPTERETWLIRVFNHCTEHLLNYAGPDQAKLWRGHSRETLKKMHVGLCPGNLVTWLKNAGCPEEIVDLTGIGKRQGDGGKVKLTDFFFKGRLLFPVYHGSTLMNITCKDPAKQLPPYQLPTPKQAGSHFYHQDAFNRFDDLILVEGEHDLLTLFDCHCYHVAAMLGSLSGEQIKLLKIKRRTKALILMMDNDAAGTAYIRKIASSGLPCPLKIIEYGNPGDDPDSYLQAFTGDRKAEVVRLEKAALPYLQWEINQAAALTSLEEKKSHLDKLTIWKLVGKLKVFDQQLYLEKLCKLGFSRQTVIEEIGKSHELRKEIQLYFSDCSENKTAIDPIKTAVIIFDYFSLHGKFSHDAAANVFLTYGNITYSVSVNPRFSALIENSTGILLSRPPGSYVMESLRNRGLTYSRIISTARWIHTTDSEEGEIFVNLNTPGNILYRLRPGGITEIVNGMNDENLLLSSSERIAPFTYQPHVEIQEGLSLFQELIFKNLPCENRQRYFLACWLISAFLLDFAPSQAHVKFSGSSAGGKTTAAKLFNMLLYGSEHLMNATGPSSYSIAATSPMLVYDNMESADLNRERQQFLLLAATRGEKTKRKGGSDTGTIDEAPRALICITAIEPFTLPELINRVVDIWFDAGEYGNPEFYEMDILKGIRRNRDKILSALLKFIAHDILPEIGTLSKYVAVLRTQHSGHSKERSNEFISLLLLILDKFLKYLPLYPAHDLLYGYADESQEITDAWILEQNRKTRDLEMASSSMLKLLDGVVWDHQVFRRTHNLLAVNHADFEQAVYQFELPEYGFEVIETRPEEYRDEATGEIGKRSMVEFVATAGTMVNAFETYCKKRAIRCPFNNAAIFGARLKNDLPLLKKSGWELVTQNNKHAPAYRVNQGYRLFKFRKWISNPTG